MSFYQRYSLGKVGCTLRTFGVPAVRGEEDYVERIWDTPIELPLLKELTPMVKYVGVTQEFKDVIDYFKVPSKETPAGFRIEIGLAADGVLRVDLVRDLSYDKNGLKRPINVLFSANTADPYEISTMSKLLANVTCNPALIYDKFINNPKANIGNKFKTRDEVIEEIGRIMGPGCDVSVELNNPLNPNFDELLEEAKRFEAILSKWRLVVKVPHTGPINNENVHELFEGNKRLSLRYNDTNAKDAFVGHNLAYRFQEEGFRVNFTLMAEPYQANLALLARPYFINTFLHHRLTQSKAMNNYLKCYEVTGDVGFLKSLRSFMIEKDYLGKNDENADLLEVATMARELLNYREFDTTEGMDGFDGARHNLRMIKNCNMPDTRLIICSLQTPEEYADLDKMLAEPEFLDMHDRIIITADPVYFSQYTSSTQVVSYQRSFLNAVGDAK